MSSRGRSFSGAPLVGAATSSTWRARVVMFLALFLVPVVIVATPSVARAAETVTRGPSVSATVDGFSLFSAVPGNDQTCSLTAQWVTPAADSILTPPFVQIGGVSCSQGNAFDNIGGADGSNMTVEFQGEGCSASTVLPISYANGFDPSQATFPGGPVAVPETCSVGEVCLTYETHGGGMASWFSHTYDTTCAAIGLGLPPEAHSAASCDFIDPYSPTGYTRNSVQYGASLQDGVAKFSATRKTTESLGSRGYGFYYVARKNGGPPTVAWLNNLSLWTDVSGVATWEKVLSGWFYTAGPDTWQITGLGLLDWSKYPSYTNTPGVAALPQNSTHPQNAAWGVTDPSRCTFYWGEKVAQIVTDDKDEPAGGLATGQQPTPPPAPVDTPVEAPPVPVADPEDGPTCEGGFSFFKPSTWAAAGFCAIVEALKNVWEAVTALGSAIFGLPGKIASAIGDLFVPSPGFVADKVDNVKSRWDDTAPMVLADEVAGLGDTFAIPAPSGCAGPPLNIDTEFTGSLSLNPLSACGPQVSVVANIVKIALTVIVYVGAGLGALRILGSSLGLDLSIDKNGE